MCKQAIKIKRNQVWRKKDTGLLIVICGKNKNDTWTTTRLYSGNLATSKKRSHHHKAHDLLKFYELVQRKGGDEE